MKKNKPLKQKSVTYHRMLIMKGLTSVTSISLEDEVVLVQT